MQRIGRVLLVHEVSFGSEGSVRNGRKRLEKALLPGKATEVAANAAWPGIKLFVPHLRETAGSI